MGILLESREETLLKSIEYAPQKTNQTALSPLQKELDFDEQLQAAISPDQADLSDAVERCGNRLIEQSEAAIIDNAKPTQVDQLLRVSFWEEVSSALFENRRVNERNIYNGVCSQSYWRDLRDNREEKFTFVLIPIKSYARTNKLLLQMGQACLYEILNASPYVKGQGSGNRKAFDPKIAKVQLEAYKMVEERQFGKAVQRLQTHNINEEKPSTAQETIEALQAEIKALEGTSGPILIDDGADE